MRRLTAPILVAGLLVGVAGCGPRTANVSGEVKFKGEPLASGRITFLCQGGTKPALSAEITDGRYEIKGVPVGRVEVTVETFNLRSDPVPGAPPPPPVPKGYKYVPIPPRYGSPTESGLGFEVTGSTQTKDFDLTP